MAPIEKYKYVCYNPDETILVSAVLESGLKRASYLINGYPGAEMVLTSSMDKILYLSGAGLVAPVEKNVTFSNDYFLRLKHERCDYPSIFVVATYILNKAIFGNVPTPQLLLAEFEEDSDQLRATFLVDKTADKTLYLQYTRGKHLFYIETDSLRYSFPSTLLKNTGPGEILSWFNTTLDPQIELFKWSATFEGTFEEGKENVNI